MHPGQFVLRLFRDGDPLSLPIQPIPTYLAVLGGRGLACGDFTVPHLRDIGALCRRMLDDGLPDHAIQVRTGAGIQVCFSMSIAAIADPVPVPPEPEAQLRLELGAP